MTEPTPKTWNCNICDRTITFDKQELIELHKIYHTTRAIMYNTQQTRQ